MKLHPSFIEKDGKREFVVLPYEEFTALQELLEDVEDLLILRQAKQSDNPAKPAIPLQKLLTEFGL
jgi:hypothetical protein